jgi:hypothetical protein
LLGAAVEYGKTDFDGGAGSMQAEAANWFTQSFQLQVCGKRIGARGAKKLLSFA